MAERERGHSARDGVDDAIASFLVAEEEGEEPSPDEWYRKYPEHKRKLAEFFADHFKLKAGDLPGKVELPETSDFAGRGAPKERLRAPGRSLGEVKPGQIIGSCRILRELGRGGMGIVYLGEHVRLKRQVAVKVLSPNRVSPEMVKRFLREARIGSSIDHPNVVVIHDVGNEGDLHYIVMSYVDGRDLSQLVAANRGPLPCPTALRLMRLALRGVGALHERKLVHRDVKPNNIMVTPDFRVLLMDFGLARDETQSSMTEAGAIVGTPAYMPPEQVRGEALDALTDIYALGGTLYYLLTGRHPYDGEALSIVAQVAAGVPPRRIEELRPDLPPQVCAIVKKAMAWARVDRYARVGLMIKDMTCALAQGESKAAYGPRAAIADALAPASEIHSSNIETFAGRPVTELVPLEPIRRSRSTWIETTRHMPRPLLWSLAGMAAVVVLMVGILVFAWPNRPVDKAAGSSDSTKIAANGKDAGKGENPSSSPLERGRDEASASNDAGANPPDASATEKSSAAGNGPRTSTPAEPKVKSSPPAAPAIEPVRTAATEVMIRIPAGFVSMGASEAKLRQHAEILNLTPNETNGFVVSCRREREERLHVEPFWIDTYETTNEQYAKFIKATGRRPPKYWPGVNPPQGRENHPVVEVTYDDAAAYAAWSGKRLPTNVQWTRAFRGDSDFMYPWGDRWEVHRCNTLENKAFPFGTSPVASSPEDVSIFGVKNLVGNVAEILRDRVEIDGILAMTTKGAHTQFRGSVYGVAPFRFYHVIEGHSHELIGFRCVIEEP